MVVPGRSGVNEPGPAKSGVGGWLLVLCLLLLIGHPARLAFGAARALGALPLRGPSLAVVVLAQMVVAAIGVAAGLALFGRHRGAPTFARWSLLVSAAMDLFVYTTSFLPNNRPPGTTPLFVFGSLGYHAIWITYLARSTRVKNMNTTW
jgi:hypothetical protein